MRLWPRRHGMLGTLEMWGGDIQIDPRRENQSSRYSPQTPEGGLGRPHPLASFSLIPSSHLQTVFFMRSQIYRLGDI